MYQFPHELSSNLTLDLMKLENFKKVPEMLGFESEYSARHFLLRNRQKSDVKHSTEKSVSLNFVNLSTIFCPRLQTELSLMYLIFSSEKGFVSAVRKIHVY